MEDTQSRESLPKGIARPVLRYTLLSCFQVLLSLALLGQESIEPGTKTIQMHRLNGDEAFFFDGKVEEAFWLDIEPTDDFYMREPLPGSPASERTEVRIAFDREHLYLAVILHDTEPDKIKAFRKRRDDDIEDEDHFIWFFDTFLDKRNAYLFAINPLGLRSDGLLTTGQGSSLNKNWDGIWDLKTHMGTFGWSAEVKIPFRTLNFNPESDAWGINFMRVIRRKNEEVLWTGYQLNQGIERPQDGGQLTGIRDVSQGIGLEAKPYATLRNEKTGTDKSENRATTGLDVNYNITANLKASLTINTDFAETEVDDRQINLTRFPLQFPEKRDFFLEGDGIYSFAPRSGINPYFSRRIGLSGGRPIPIRYGARILGRVGNLDVAALHVRTGKKDDLPPEDFSVLRLKQNLGAESTLGFVYTRRATQDGDLFSEPLQDRHTVGADLHYGTSEFFGDKNFQLQAFVVVHNAPTPTPDGLKGWDRSSRGLRLNFPNRPWFAHCSYREFGHGYDPAVGFNRRNGIKRVEPAIGYAPIFRNSKVIREITWRVLYQNLWDFDFKLLTQNLQLILGAIRFESGERLSFEMLRNFERLTGPFDILRDERIIVPVGEYANWTTIIEASTAPFRKVVGTIEFRRGGFWTGDRTVWDIGTIVRLRAGLNVSLRYVHTDVQLAEGSFETDLFQFEGSYDFTPDLSISSIVQYDNLSKQFGMNNRLRWIITPGSDVYLVFNHNWLRHAGEYRLLDRASVLKANYTHRF